jgi:hypothetical protein
VADRVCISCWTWFSSPQLACPTCGAALATAGAAPSSSGPRGARHLRRVRWLRWILALAISGALALALFPMPQLGLWGQPGCSLPIGGCTRVLFIGDSLTSVNDLPTTFADLAWAGGHRVETAALDAGGETLAEHETASVTSSTVGSEPWSDVVLQEQSEIPSVASLRTTEMYPAATRLVSAARRQGARPILYLTFAHQDGWSAAGLLDYPSMQAAVDSGYLGIATQLGVAIAPVGAAWQSVIDQPSPPSLWQPDGVHPTVTGTYLAACVFYATIFAASPVGLGDDDGLPSGEARDLQSVAAATVLGDPSRWGLPG